MNRRVFHFVCRLVVMKIAAKKSNPPKAEPPQRKGNPPEPESEPPVSDAGSTRQSTSSTHSKLLGQAQLFSVDFASQSAGKLQALEYVRQQLGYDHANTIACGDSGNDLDMLDGNHHAIVVGNAHEELRLWALDSAKDDERSRSLVLVKKHRAFGILEGLQSLGFLS